MLNFHCKRKCIMRVALCMALLIAGSLWKVFPAQAIELGKTYDKSNYQEIEDLLIPPMSNWVKKGEFVIKTGALNFVWEQMEKYFTEASQANLGKYDINEKALLVHKDNGELVTSIFGLPFPEIDPKDPLIAEKIMENFYSEAYSSGSLISTAKICWVGKGGFERSLVTCGAYFSYLQIRGDPIPNPVGYKTQSLADVMAPYDLRGTSFMDWSYLDEREGSSFMYLPMLRRIRRGSAAAGSDPFLGSDACSDDGGCWDGKNADMNFKLLGEKTVLCPFMGVEKDTLKTFPDGSVDMPYQDLDEALKMGYEIPDFQGAPWCAPDLIYSPRECLLMEMHAKDPYYNYGKQILYIDKTALNAYYKVIWDRSGEYWKTVIVAYGFGATKGDEDYWRHGVLYWFIDDKTNHASLAIDEERASRPNRYNLPIDVLGPSYFTTANMIQLSK